jgi:hypothetical protein
MQTKDAQPVLVCGAYEEFPAPPFGAHDLMIDVSFFAVLLHFWQSDAEDGTKGRKRSVAQLNLDSLVRC